MNKKRQRPTPFNTYATERVGVPPLGGRVREAIYPQPPKGGTPTPIKRARRLLLRAWALGFLMFQPVLSAQVSPEQLAYELSTRYAPYANGAAALDLELLTQLEAEAWWRSPEAIRAARTAGDLPLAGLHLALDPGHIGGDWAEWEWRNFRIANDDFWVREGELVLEVAQRVGAQLSRLGAEVTLLRESFQPINPKTFIDYWPIAAAELEPPGEVSLQVQLDHALAVRNRAIRLAIVTGEIAERARVVNQVIRPDALISLHINAAQWPEGDTQQLVETNHSHVLIFGCLSEQELASPRQLEQLAKKLINGSGAIEAALGATLGAALTEAIGLPASVYKRRNAIRFNADAPCLWARNLMLLRLADCPTVLLEPFIANNQESYPRIQQALAARAVCAPLEENDILIEYADAVVDGVLRCYGE